MTVKKPEESEKERVREQGTTLRCLNCFSRFKIERAAEKVACQKCGQEYMIGWRGKGGGQAKILGVPIE